MAAEPYTSFEAFRTLTGWQRPSRAHGCKPVELAPGVWTAHYHDIDSVEKLKAATKGAPIALVVNSALCQCEARDGFWGPNVKVLEVELEDDPDPRKQFDQGKASTSECAKPNIPVHKRCPGDAKRHFDRVTLEMERTLLTGGHVLVHCHASLSRSVAFLLAFFMKTKGMTLLEAGAFMKPKWDATWPCDRFVFQLMEYERELERPYRLSSLGLAGVFGLG
eukprot:CAMPEP_0119268290 /NCGR_PEP_ID=MMETSP1329-20130426/6115_1 /TAXON_ID=114041 /ORGANISM="Genus nov. species nov., Strain RCC1024" /LENGTH=220 /DNA_ID=CAMNT_0007268253 /DNA_START=161 /DNA_END=820 /DNA_ORIENTATION=-